MLASGAASAPCGVDEFSSGGPASTTVCRPCLPGENHAAAATAAACCCHCWCACKEQGAVDLGVRNSRALAASTRSQGLAQAQPYLLCVCHRGGAPLATGVVRPSPSPPLPCCLLPNIHKCTCILLSKVPRRCCRRLHKWRHGPGRLHPHPARPLQHQRHRWGAHLLPASSLQPASQPASQPHQTMV